jgi:hypothetical protein
MRTSWNRTRLSGQGELARAAGAFIGMAHPAASLLTLADAESLDAAHAVEVYNALSAWGDRG